MRNEKSCATCIASLLSYWYYLRGCTLTVPTVVLGIENEQDVLLRISGFSSEFCSSKADTYLRRNTNTCTTSFERLGRRQNRHIVVLVVFI